jgi:hypothetical protein
MLIYLIFRVGFKKSVLSFKIPYTVTSVCGKCALFRFRMEERFIFEDSLKSLPPEERERRLHDKAEENRQPASQAINYLKFYYFCLHMYEHRVLLHKGGFCNGCITKRS